MVPLRSTDRLARMLRAGVSLREACRRQRLARSIVYRALDRGALPDAPQLDRYLYESLQLARGRSLAGPPRLARMRRAREVRTSAKRLKSHEPKNKDTTGE